MPDNDRSFNVFYCEDVRLEITGQTSIIGVFNADVNAPSFPVSLPKLCVLVEIETSVDDLLQSLRILVQADSGEVFVDQIVPSEVLAQQSAIASTANFDGLDERRLSFRTQFFVTPFRVAQPTIIRARLLTERGEIKGRALRLSQGDLLPAFGTVTM
ncbi:DUF6941 family protein [Cupriavidus plantarum]|uniref:DUF6941 family protein n=1 Tax=Cupriavidus plantarum TaxID=942865 RepID=UPI001B294026|nr:hypothetical protein [Cupriavidus plantarum]CAG2134756.1 hypothetical protein LMG26296_02077 [Cupriavidus plantarum]SMR84462.1 hypothetical protein SAMN05421735_3249 [Cupriavidus plantarum]